MSAADAVSYYEVDLRVGLLPFAAADARTALAGHDLACWCPLDSPCHADILLKAANAAAGVDSAAAPDRVADRTARLYTSNRTRSLR
jgi:hypothetical protein